MPPFDSRADNNPVALLRMDVDCHTTDDEMGDAMGIGFFGRALGLALLFSLSLAPSCVDTAADDRADGPHDAFLLDGKEDSASVKDGSPEACGVLRLASSATSDVLSGAIHVDRRAVANILAYRAGADGVAGTADDRVFNSMPELDAISYVGPVAFSKMVRYVRAHALECKEIDLRFLAVADVHGQLDPVPVANVGNVGGAALLAGYFQNERAANPYTAVVSAGDLFGASPPLAMYFREKPMVEAANLLRVSANALGNHEFDRGLPHLTEMIEAARFPFISANVAGANAAMHCPSRPGGRCVEPFVIQQMGGVKVAFIGLTTTETPGLVKPGTLGGITFSDPLAAAQLARRQAAAKGARVFVLLAHIGGVAPATPDAAPTGPIVDLARGLTGFDAIIGGHTHTALNAVVNGVPVTENKSQSQTYTRIELKYDFTRKTVTNRTASTETPVAAATLPNVQAVSDLLAPYRSELSAAFDVPVGLAAGIFERDGTVERSREVALGDLVADAVRAHAGSQLAYLNGGGLRAPLPSTYSPADHTLRRTSAGYAAGAPYDLVLGDVFAVLPFGNAVATQTITGAQLWKMLEHAVDAIPGAKGYFAQISGFKFVYDSSRAANARVVSVTGDDGHPIAADATAYTMTTSDFIAAGGDGYTLLASVPAQTGDSMADILRAYIHAAGTITPTTGGRITNRAAP